MNKPLSGDLLKWIRRKNEVLKISDKLASGIDASERERIFWQLTKLSEEFGELSDAVFTKFKLQRAEKMRGNIDDEVAGEVADVIIVALLLADRLGVDTNKALTKKLAKIDKRFAHIKLKK